MNVKTQKFFILGVSKSGFAAAEYILKSGGECYLYEELKSDKIDTAIRLLVEMGAKIVGESNIEGVLNEIEVLIISPGAPINHRVAVRAKQLGKRIISELEFGFLAYSPTTVAVTGTNGKTTTVTLINAILNAADIKSLAVGNVGIPVSKTLMEKQEEKVLVTEVSSFQLEGTNAFCPHISCVLNISPDHLERHYNMENYIFLKKRIFKNQRESEYCVLNFDDQVVKQFAPEVKAKILWVSSRERVDGAYRLDGKLFFQGEYVIDESNLKLRGEHNVSDTLFAIACAKLLKVPTDKIVESLTNFKGIKHRIEFVGNYNGVSYYNDSKATNTASTMSALDTIDGNIILILGGSEKGENYDALFSKIKERQIKHVILTGSSRFNMLEAAGKSGYYDTTVTAKFDDAIKISKLFATGGDNVLLSPACASFDAFSGYEERGERFISLVEEECGRE